MTPLSAKKSIWGVGAWLLYGGFALFILSFVVVALRQQFDLVENDYYEKGLAHQEKIERRQNAVAGDRTPRITYDPETGTCLICFTHLTTMTISGTCHFFRPSDAEMDFSLPVSCDATACQRVEDSRLKPGLWRVKIDWSDGRTSFYAEQKLVVKER